MRIRHAVVGERRAPAAVSATPTAAAGRSDRAANRRARCATASLPGRGRHHLIHQPPFDGARPRTPSSVVQNRSARSRRTLRLSVSRVSPPVPGSTASSGSLRQRDRGAAVVDQHDVLGGHRELVAAAGSTAADRGQVELAGMFALASSIARRVSLVNLQKFTLCPCVALPSMRIFAPAQNTPSLPERQDDRSAPRDARSAAAARRRPARYRRRDRTNSASARSPSNRPPAGSTSMVSVRHRAVERQPPMAVARRVGLEIDHRRSRRYRLIQQLALRANAARPPPASPPVPPDAASGGARRSASSPPDTRRMRSSTRKLLLGAIRIIGALQRQHRHVDAARPAR